MGRGRTVRRVAALWILAMLICLTICASGCEKEEELTLREEVEAKLKSVRSVESSTDLLLDFTMEQQVYFKASTLSQATTNPWRFDAGSLWEVHILDMEESSERRFMGEMADESSGDGDRENEEDIEKNVILYSYHMDNWVKRSNAGKNEYGQHDVLWQFKLLAAAMDDMKEGNSRIENKRELLRLDGAAPRDFMAKIVYSSAFKEAFGSALRDLVWAETVKSDDGDGTGGEGTGGEGTKAQVTLWIDMKSKLPVRYELDLSNIVRAAIREGGPEFSDVSEASLRCQVTAYDKAEEILIPEWARSAPEQ